MFFFAKLCYPLRPLRFEKNYRKGRIVSAKFRNGCNACWRKLILFPPQTIEFVIIRGISGAFTCKKKNLATNYTNYHELISNDRAYLSTN